MFSLGHKMLQGKVRAARMGQTYHGEMLKFEISLVPKIMSRLGQLDPDHILDPDSKLAIGIVARLVRYHMSGLQRCIVIVRLGTYTLRTLVHIQK